MQCFKTLSDRNKDEGTASADAVNSTNFAYVWLTVLSVAFCCYMVYNRYQRNSSRAILNEREVSSFLVETEKQDISTLGSARNTDL